MAEPFTIGGWSFEPDQLMTLPEVAAAFRVDPQTVTRWAVAGKLTCLRTPGIRGYGQRRYSRQQVQALMRGQTTPRQAAQ